MQAHVLALDEFNKPKVYEADDAAYIHIIYLILLEPGKYQSHPNMGVGIRSRYRHNNDSEWEVGLGKDIQSQINTYLPEVAAVDVTVTINEEDHILGIIIDTTSGSYVIAYDNENDKAEAAASYVLNDLDR